MIPKEKQDGLMIKWDDYLRKGKKVIKFVPASGAASRMFKGLFEYITAPYDEPTTPFEKQFFEHLFHHR